MDAAAQGGVINIIGLISQAHKDQMPDVASTALVKELVIRGIRVGGRHYLEEVVKFAETHSLKIPIDKTFNFKKGEVVDAFNYLASAGHIGKVCIKVD